MMVEARRDMARARVFPQRRSALHADLLLLVVVLAEDVFGLIDASAINIAGVVNIDLVWQALLLVLSVHLYVQSLKMPGMGTSALQGTLFGCLIAMCFVAAYRCNVLTGQPFMRGFIPQRGFMVCIVAAILLRRPFRTGLVDVHRLIQGLIVLGSIASVLYLLQMAVGHTVTFIHAQLGYKYGGLRLYIDGAASTVAGILSLWVCLKRGNWRYIVPSLLALAVMLFVSKGRLELVVYLATMLVLTISAKGSARVKVLIICLFGLAFIFFGQSRYAAEVIDSFLNSSAGGNDATGVIREAGREWYQYVMSSQPYGVLLGCGYPSTLYEPAIEMAGFQYGYFLVDNGIYGYRYVYGDLGVALVLLSLATTLWYSLRGRQDVFGSMLFAFYFFLFVPFINLAWWWGTADWEVLVAVFVALGWKKSIHLSKSGGEHAQKN